MPTYRYLCSKCGEEFDVDQPITAPALTTHEGCGGKLQKVFSPVGIVFKGSGFHKTDSRKSAATSQTASESKSESASEKSEKSEKTEKSEKKETTSSDQTSSSEKKDTGQKEKPST